jgi:hypothetical protein
VKSAKWPRVAWLSLVLVFHQGCGKKAGSGGGCPDSLCDEPALTTVSFTESSDNFLNPERGFVGHVDLLGTGSFGFIRANGWSIAMASVRLDAYNASDLPQSVLDALQAGFGRARQAGIKVVLRFSYNACMSCPDASKAWILRHIEQLQPVLAQNWDVILLFQAGFIGSWGEWHSSTNGLENTTDRRDILEAMLAALPAARMTQVRSPVYSSELFGPALTNGEAFSGTNKARTGQYNDCFLASDSDFGTYPSPIETWKEYVEQQTRFTPMGGETCAVYSPRSDCLSAMAEMERLHWSYLNSAYNTDVLDDWTEQGCMPDAQRRLGYRFSLTTASWSEKVKPGGILQLDATVKNSGFAAPFNARGLHVVLDAGAVRHSVRLSAANTDPRHWLGGTETRFVTKLRIPADLAPGSYRLSLWLPDDVPALAADPDYAIRLANDDVWEAASGLNVIAAELPIDAGATGSSDPAATSFVELP